MIGTVANEKRLASIDGATALGQLADDALLAVFGWRETQQLDERGVQVLGTFAAWLDAISESLVDPIKLATAATSRWLPGLDSFGPSQASATFGLMNVGEESDSTVEVLQRLKALIAAIAEGRTDGSEDVDGLQIIFESIAQAMLSNADALLSPSVRTTWATTLDF